MSDTAVQIVNGTLTYDFRTTQSYFFGQKQINTNLGVRYAMYAGNGEFIHAPRTGKKVRIEKLSNTFFARTYVGGRTYL